MFCVIVEEKNVQVWSNNYILVLLLLIILIILHCSWFCSIAWHMQRRNQQCRCPEPWVWACSAPFLSLWLHTGADGVPCWDAGVGINIPAWNAVGLLAIPDPDYWSAVPDLPIAMFWEWHRVWEQTACREEKQGWEGAAPVASPQHCADKSQSHLTKSLTTK